MWLVDDETTSCKLTEMWYDGVVYINSLLCVSLPVSLLRSSSKGAANEEIIYAKILVEQDNGGTVCAICIQI